MVVASGPREGDRTQPGVVVSNSQGVQIVLGGQATQTSIFGGATPRASPDEFRADVLKLLAGRAEGTLAEAVTQHLVDEGLLPRRSAAGTGERISGGGVTLLKSGTAVVRALIARLGDQDGDVRQAAVRALSSREGTGVVRALAGRLRDDDAGAAATKSPGPARPADQAGERVTLGADGNQTKEK